ncbi:MAG: hypothetical protein DCC58_02820 [Chloroflexi bacterium]|nr:MAG: hypothetical protein DCC58_02820 [Chloroflexota bacterium]
MPSIVCADGDDEYLRILTPEIERAMTLHGVSVTWHNGAPTSEEDWLERTAGAEGLLLLWDIPDNVLRTHPTLRAISWVGTGVGTFVNVPLATERGIAVCNTPGYGDNAVGEHALGLMLALARNTVALDGALRSGRWPRDEVRGFELGGKTVGIVGLGGIGTRVARLCAALDMRVLAWTAHPTPERLQTAHAVYAELPELFAQADIVSLHLAHTPETTGIVSAELLARMRKHAILVNTARAELVDPAALVDMLRSGRIAGAALDVFDHEPLEPHDPLLQLPNVVLTPHVGFRTPEATRRTITTALDNLLGFFAGSPRHVVNPEVLRWSSDR